MPRHLSLLLTLTIVTGSQTQALASRVVVPDDYSTLQAAIDSGADTVAVRDGVAPERITVSRFVAIEPGPGVLYFGRWVSMPSIRSLEVLQCFDSGNCTGVSVRGCRFLGKVVLGDYGNFGRIAFDGCRFDSAFAGPLYGPTISFELRACLILGGISVHTSYMQILGNTVLGGGIEVSGDGICDIRNNFIQGPAAVGLLTHLDVSVGPIQGNTIRGVGEGMVLDPDGYVDPVADNVIEDCDSHGIRYAALAFPENHLAYARGNTVRRVGGDGIRVEDRWAATLSGNHIEDAHGAGIRTSGVETYSTAVDSNVVLRSGQQGMTVDAARFIRGNVVGRSAGSGIRVAGWLTQMPMRLAANTSYANGGAGFETVGSSGSTPDTVIANLAALNAGAGLVWSGSPAPLLACNDWYSNSGGATQGVAPAGSDLQLAPEFCDLPGDNVFLTPLSPLLDAPGCGLIGARGEGCASTVSVAPSGAAGRSSLRAWPVPSTGTIDFDMPAIAGDARLEVYDVTGAKRWEAALSPAKATVTWDGRDAHGQRLPPGVYYARVRTGRENLAGARVVLTR
jgi:hypothetical protein